MKTLTQDSKKVGALGLLVMALSHVHFFLPFRPASIPTTDIPTGKQRLIATNRCSDHRLLWLVEQDMAAAGIYHFP